MTSRIWKCIRKRLEHFTVQHSVFTVFSYKPPIPNSSHINTEKDDERTHGLQASDPLIDDEISKNHCKDRDQIVVDRGFGVPHTLHGRIPDHIADDEGKQTRVKERSPSFKGNGAVGDTSDIFDTEGEKKKGSGSHRQSC